MSFTGALHTYAIPMECSKLRIEHSLRLVQITHTVKLMMKVCTTELVDHAVGHCTKFTFHIAD